MTRFYFIFYFLEKVGVYNLHGSKYSFRVGNVMLPRSNLALLCNLLGAEKLQNFVGRGCHNWTMVAMMIPPRDLVIVLYS